MPALLDPEEEQFGHPLEEGEEEHANTIDDYLNSQQHTSQNENQGVQQSLVDSINERSERSRKEQPAPTNEQPTPQLPDDATPEYVNKQPDRAPRQPQESGSLFQKDDPNQVVGPDSAKLKQRVSTDQLTGHIHSQPLPNPANAGANVAKQAGKTAGKVAGKAANEVPVASQVVTALGDISEIKNAEGIKGKAKAVKGAAEDVAVGVAEGAIDATGIGAVVMAGLNLVLTKDDKRDIIEGASGDFRAYWRILKRHYKLFLVPAIVGALFAALFGLAIGAIFSSIFGNSPGVIGIPGASTFISTGANPNGLYLDIMTDHLTIKSPKTGQAAVSLSLEATSGGYSDETDARIATASNAAGVTGDDGRSIIGRACLYNTKTGAWRDENSGNDHDATSGVDCLAGASVYNPATDSSRQMTNDELKWYVTARWPYVKTYWPGTHGSGVKTVLNPAEPVKYFRGIKVVLYDPATNKAVIGMASEWGPSPAVGISSADLAAQKTSWMYGPFGPQPRVQVPEGYEGRVAGGGSAIRDALGESSDGPLIIGYLDPTSKAANLPLGLVPANMYHVIQRGGADVTSTIGGKVPLLKQGNYPNVPYTSTGNSKQTIATSGCGIVSSAMVLMYDGKQVSVPDLAQFSVSNGYRTSNSGTSYGYFPAIASHFGLKSQNLTGNWDSIINTLKAGTPVIVAGKHDSSDPRPFSVHGHFVVLTGVTSDGKITVNDPAGKPNGNRDNQAYPQDLIRSYYTYAVAITK